MQVLCLCGFSLKHLGSGVEGTGVGRPGFGEFFVCSASFRCEQETSQPVAACRAQDNFSMCVVEALQNE